MKFSYKEQKEFETIDEDIEKLEEKIAELEEQISKCATDFIKLNELMQEKEKTEAELSDKMERWVYLNDLAEKIEAQTWEINNENILRGRYFTAWKRSKYGEVVRYCL